MAPPKQKSVKPPALPVAAATPSDISEQALSKGEQRDRKRGRAATRLTTGFLSPAPTSRSGLKTKLGGS